MVQAYGEKLSMVIATNFFANTPVKLTGWTLNTKPRQGVMDKIYSVTQYFGLVKVNMISVLALKMFVYLDLNHNTKIYLKFLIYELIIRVARISA